ncbi:MAG: hypothetical protein C4325_08055, partial [Blastocatellia bacterium]
MSWHTDQLKYALGFGGVLSFYGILTLITYLVPLPQIGYYERTAILLAFVVITLPFVALFGFIVSRRRKRREQAENAAVGSERSASEASPRPIAGAGNYP